MTLGQYDPTKNENARVNQYRMAISSEGKSIVVAYLFWFFLGYLGAHRFYLEKYKTGAIMNFMTVIGAILSMLTFGVGMLPVILWWLIDIYFVYAYLEKENARLGVSTLGYSVVTSAQSITNASNLSYLEKLFELKQKGALTEEEYQHKKREVIDTSYKNQSSAEIDSVQSFSDNFKQSEKKDIMTESSESSLDKISARLSALERLVKLKESGVLRDDEFASEKERVLKGQKL